MAEKDKPLWLRKAITMKHPRLAVGLAASVPYTINPIEKKLLQLQALN